MSLQHNVLKQKPNCTLATNSKGIVKYCRNVFLYTSVCTVSHNAPKEVFVFIKTSMYAESKGFCAEKESQRTTTSHGFLYVTYT